MYSFRSCLVVASTVLSGAVACSGEEVAPNPLVAPPDAPVDVDTVSSGIDAALDSTTTLPPDAVDINGSCGGVDVKATARDANVLLVVDKSGSMLQTPSGFSVSKWEAMRTSLREALGPVQSKLSLGLLLFPYDPSQPIAASCSGNCCALASGGAAVNVGVAPGVSSLDQIVAAIDATSPGGATPTARALDAALAYYTKGAGKDLVGDKYVLLATDGGPNCNEGLTCGAATCTTNLDGSCGSGNCCDPARSRISCLDADAVVGRLGALSAAGIKTFVVGIPGSEAYKTYLDAFAVAGGATAPAGPTKYFAVDAAGGVAGLTSVFTLITGELITSCTLGLDGPPPDPNQVNVYVDGAVVPASGPDGWTLDLTTKPPTIDLQGATCASVKSKGAKSIRVVYGCPTIR